jgi:hypothetical protein
VDLTGRRVARKIAVGAKAKNTSRRAPSAWNLGEVSNVERALATAGR